MPDKPPNVIVLFTDQQRWDTVGAYGANPMDLTPNTDAMAARGTIFENALTCQPVCAPARGSILTGRPDYRAIADDLCARLKRRILEAGESEPTIHPARYYA